MAEQYCFERKLNNYVDECFDGISAPFSAGIELTAKCNLNCIHCYAKPGRDHSDMTTEEYKFLIDQLVERGLLELYLTGGEILTRPDFQELYVYTKKKGLLVSLLSNITLLNDELLELFRKYPPEIISTTMYGYSPETYEAVTGDPRGYEKFMSGLQKLMKSGLKFEIKYVGMTQNYDDIYRVRELGAELGVPMVVICDVHPMSDGSTKPMEYRLTPEEAFEFDIKDKGRRCFWESVGEQLMNGEIETIPQRTKNRFEQGYLYPCSIGSQHCFISSDLKLQGCVRASYDSSTCAKEHLTKVGNIFKIALLIKRRVRTINV